MKRFIVIVLITALLPWLPWVGSETERAAAAGELLEFNDVHIPAVQLNATRPRSYEGDVNWYEGSMKIDLPAVDLTGMTYNKVTGELHINMSNLYTPTSWIAMREPLPFYPKSPDRGSRWTHGYITGYAGKLVITFTDGTQEQIGSVGGGSFIDSGNNPTYFDSTRFAPTVFIPKRVYFAPPHDDQYYTDYVYLTPAFSTYLTVGKTPKSIQFLQSFSDEYWTGDVWQNSGSYQWHHAYTVNDERVWPLSTNKKPNLTLTSHAGQNIINDAGLSTFNVEGYVQDPDNDTVDVIAEIPNVFYKKITLANTGSPKNFSIPIDVLSEGIPPGQYTVTVKVVDPFSMKAEATTSFSVTNRLRNKAFFLINTPIDIGTSYADYENDPKSADRYRYDQDPGIFDNVMGLIPDSGLWRSSKYTSFPYSGAYTAVHQARDNPDYDDRFDHYRLWSRDNLSSMTFMVHRKPVALFTAKLVNDRLQLTDSSYDLDHASSPTKGLVTWQWQYRISGAETWIEGQPPAQLPTNDAYEIRLRVRDMDGPSGLGVWSDWLQQTVGSPSNLPPVALFTVDHNTVSYRKSTVITDRSYDPDNDPLDIYSWAVIKDGWNTVWSSYGGAAVPPNIAAFGVGSYQINLQVHDNRGLWSGIYTQYVQVMNQPPVANFTMPNEVYRDTLVTMNNMTPDPDEDGDNLTYSWNSRLNTGPYYWTGGNRNQTVKIKDLLAQSGITDKAAISDGWEMRLTASDGKLSSNATQMFSVKNHIPAAAISGDAAAYQYDTRTFRSADYDEDTSDQSSLKYYWRVTDSRSGISLYQTKDVDITFEESGVYTLEHWAVDQIGDKSNIAALKVNVTQNLAPSITLTSPKGTAAAPAVIDAEQQGDPLIQWTYNDPEKDPQEKYRLEFYDKDGLLAKAVENTDPDGLLRQYQLPNFTFERFKYYTVYGRAYSKLSWSEISNERTFIIDNPPQPGFSLVTDTGRNAAQVPVYRTDTLNIKGTGTDEDIVNGDSITYKYYLKPAGGTEGLASSQSDFTKQFSTNGIFTLRQVVTDSLGLSRELTRTITVANRIPAVNVTYPASSSSASPTVVSTLTPVMKWDYQDEDGDLQQRFKVRIINLVTGAVTVQSGEQLSGASQWQVPANTLAENEKYAVEVEAYDGYSWSSVSPRKYFMVNLLSVKGGVQHTVEWNKNRQAYNLAKSGNAESPRGIHVFWAGEKFVLQADATGLPDTIEVTMGGGYKTELSPTDSNRTLWTGELYDPAFEKLPDGPVTFTFTARNAYNTKTDNVTVSIMGDWSEYYQHHRIK
ncbi:hypothetical protein [Paenibacillus sp. PK3_47]|uniref:hypothetical protein n=1 Tax=Paenibacillus sp. PK3_47 TaxID=2072642 RepID=UPI00201D89C6|nr:hypothetical protein [Paenibacillus sp. PK3_47]